jgi:hypothetical protein
MFKNKKRLKKTTEKIKLLLWVDTLFNHIKEFVSEYSDLL